MTFSLILLGIVQGLTEFLPISSSGHLILARELLGIQTADGLAVDAVLQLATALAVVVYFRNDFARLLRGSLSYVRGNGIASLDKILIGAIIFGTIPAIIAGLFLEEHMDTVFRSAELVAWMLLVGSALFAFAEWVGKRQVQKSELTLWRGVVIGLFQCLALIPGMSRSGSTISGGLILGLSREDAARFGFLLSAPIILGSGFKKLLELEASGLLSSLGFPLFLSSITAFGVGLLAIHYLLRYLKSHSLGIFILYRVLLALVVLGIVYL